MDSVNLMTANQLRLYFEWKKNPASTAYHNIFLYRLKGKLNQDALIQAINLIAEIYPELRTYIIIKDFHPLTKCCENIFPIEVYDWREKNLTEKKILETIEELLKKPFEFNSPPLYRHVLVRQTENCFFLGLCWHHLIDDALSVNLIVSKISELYSLITNKLELKIQPLNLNSEPKYTIENLKYWKNKLASCNHFSIDLPSQKKIPSTSPHSKRLYFNLDQEISSNVMKFIAQHEISLFVFLSGCFAALCYRFSDQNDLLMGYSVNMRDKDQLDRVGFYVNNLPLRCEIKLKTTFLQLFEDIKLQRDNDTLHRNVPLTVLLKEIRQAQHNLNINNLFNILINQFTNISFELQLKNIEIEPIPIEINDAKNDFTLFYDYNGLVKLEIEYRLDLFHNDFIQQLISSFYLLIDQIIKNPNQLICHMDLLDAKSYLNIVHAWNTNPANYSCETTLIDLFKSELVSVSKKVAIYFKEESLTYAQIDQHSDMLAQYFITKCNLNKGQPIALMAERSIETFLSILAILKAGGIYLPVDPSHPLERIQYIIQNAQPLIIIFPHRNICRFQELYDFFKNNKILISREILDAQALSHFTFTHLTPDPSDPCYIIYTSGTTGQPKGVINCYRGVVNRLLWMIDRYPIQPEDVFLLKTPFSFDISVWEIFIPIIAKVRLVIAEPESHKDPHRLIQLITERKVTIIHFVPSMLLSFLEFCPKDLTLPLRLVICSGEALTYNIVKTFKNKFPNIKLLNLYGPTEASIDVTWWDCDNQEYDGIIPIGKAMPNVQLYILDQNMKPVPLGIKGELYIGGISLARGYLNKPELTQQKFLPNPFNVEGNIYKTGDLVRWLSSKTIEYLGRLDSQIKFNGNRIELAEIEYHLSSHPDVQSCVVDFNTTENNHRLYGFVLMKKNIPFNEEDIKVFLRNKLPHFMLPQRLIPLECIPLTSHGKIDRKSLWKFKELESVIEVNPKADWIFDKVVEIWSNVLNISIDIINYNSNFFSLGGDSLTALKVIARVEQHLGLEIPVTLLLEYPILKEFHRSLIQLENKNLVGMLRENYGTSLGFFPLSCSQINLLSGNNNVVLPLQWSGKIELELLSMAIDQLIKGHSMLRARINIKKSSYTITSEYGESLIDFEDLTQYPDDYKINYVEVSHKKLVDQDVDIEKDRLFFVKIFKIQETEYRLLFYFNHLIADYTSLEIFFNQLFGLYHSFFDSNFKFDIRFGDFSSYVLREKQFLASHLYEQQIEYWVSKLRGKKRLILEFPSNNDEADYYEESLDVNEIESIHKLVRYHKKTYFIILITLFRTSLTELIQDDLFSIGFAMSQRTKLLDENIIGPILNYSLIYPSVHLGTPYYLQLSEIERDFILANNYGAVPIDRIITALQKVEDNNRVSLFNVFFSFEINKFFYDTPFFRITHTPLIHTNKTRRYLSVRVRQELNEFIIGVRFRKNLFTINDVKRLVISFKEKIISESMNIKNTDIILT